MKLQNFRHYRSFYVKIALLAVCIVLVAIALLSSYEYWSFSAVQSVALESLSYVERYPVRGIIIFTLLYFCICALPMPLVSVFTMVAGYLFDNIVGLLIVSFMSALGGTLMFLMVRYIFRDWVKGALKGRFSYLEGAVEANSFMAALSLRLIPGMPFSVPAITLGLSQLSLWKFYVSTQLGLLITLFVYVNAGRSLAQVHSVQDVLTPSLIGSMLLLAIVPLVLHFIIRWVKSSREDALFGI